MKRVKNENKYIERNLCVALVIYQETLRLGYKINHLMLYKEIIAVCSDIHTKHINTLLV